MTTVVIDDKGQVYGLSEFQFLGEKDLPRNAFTCSVEEVKVLEEKGKNRKDWKKILKDRGGVAQW